MKDALKVVPSTSHVSTGVRDTDAIAKALSGVLADTYRLVFKTHAYHWNVEGPHFSMLHALFEEQYTELWNALDEIAERVRMLGAYAPRNTSELTAGNMIKPETGHPTASEMLSQLIQDNETVVETLKASVETAEAAGDDVTAGLLLDRQAIHEKTIWTLKSTNK